MCAHCIRFYSVVANCKVAVIACCWCSQSHTACRTQIGVGVHRNIGRANNGWKLVIGYSNSLLTGIEVSVYIFHSPGNCSYSHRVRFYSIVERSKYTAIIACGWITQNNTAGSAKVCVGIYRYIRRAGNFRQLIVGNCNGLFAGSRIVAVVGNCPCDCMCTNCIRFYSVVANCEVAVIACCWCSQSHSAGRA